MGLILYPVMVIGSGENGGLSKGGGFPLEIRLKTVVPNRNRQTLELYIYIYILGWFM